MNIELKAKLKYELQKFLDKHADEIGSEGIWQDNTSAGANAHIMATAVETVIDAMALQDELERRFNK